APPREKIPERRPPGDGLATAPLRQRRGRYVSGAASNRDITWRALLPLVALRGLGPRASRQGRLDNMLGKKNRTMTSILLVCALAVVPLAAADYTVTGASSDLDAAGAKAKCNEDQLSQMVDNALSPQLNPLAEACPEFHGGCTTSTTTTTTATGTGWNLIVWVSVEVQVKEDVETAIDCSGYFDVDVVHWGGTGARIGSSTLLAHAGAHTGNANLDLDSLNSGSTGQPSGCSYVGPIGSCSEPTTTGQWQYHNVVKGEIKTHVGEYTACADIQIDNTPANVIVGVQGQPDSQLPGYVSDGTSPVILQGTGTYSTTKTICGVVHSASADGSSASDVFGVGQTSVPGLLGGAKDE